MADILVEKDRNDNYFLEIFSFTKEIQYVNETRKIVEFVKNIYRYIEPSHFKGKIIVFSDLSDEIIFSPEQKEDFYDKSILSDHYRTLIFQTKPPSTLPLIWKNIENNKIDELLEKEDNFIAYVYEDEQEYFIVNNQKIDIINKFSCPSIFASQYHDLDEALLHYKKNRIKNTSCVLFKNCWGDDKRIYLKNKPEDCMQQSLEKFLADRIRGVYIKREYNMDASKPVDVRVFWREANRAALIELKWLGQSLQSDSSIGTSYSNVRANEGMSQIKEYIDLENSDSSEIITKGYLVVIDCRRKNIKSSKVSSISRVNGFHYAGKELEINEDKMYWKTFPNIEKPYRMFAEPICEV